ncbi:MAG TPA: SURF1 family protein [Luteimonas sp.]|nr:SURF1 family protein [Luteimonas sp.]
MSRGQTLGFGWLLALIGIALFAWLGFWQLDRMHQKRAMLDVAHQVLQQRHAVPLSAAADMQRTRGYDWSAGEGRFAELPAILLDNQEREGRAGVRVYRVFEPAHAAPLLVELGWLPLPGDRHMPTVPRPEGAFRVDGLLLPPPSAGIARAIAAPQADGALLTIALDVPMLRNALSLSSLAPRVLKLDPALPLGFARDLDILPNTLPPERHLGYAVQWFGLALTVLVTAVVLTFRKPRR